MSAGARVLIVDDEPIVREVLARYLKRGGFGTVAAADGASAVAAFERDRPDLVILDLMLPRLDGLEVFRRIRAQASTPVIMLTAKGDETDRVVGLEIGADDYVVKPFSPREILARVTAVLRRSERSQAEDPAERAIDLGWLRLDSRPREASADGVPLSLTPREFDLLHFLAIHPRAVFTRDQLLAEVWDLAFDGDPSTVTVHVRRLREKIEADPSRPRRLITVWGRGYRLEP
jgi:two-component system response regulator ResD